MDIKNTTAPCTIMLLHYLVTLNMHDPKMTDKENYGS